VTRIISGFAGSLTLTVPGTGTRPTSDRVREAIFSALESRDALRDARVVDLYAGSGALGLEAASRGAATVTLVEKDAAAARACRNNMARILRNAPKSAEPRIAVAAQSVQTFLDTSSATWDLALLDPPYGVGADELARVLNSLVPRLAQEAIILVERASKAPEPVWPTGITLDRRKDYGDTTLWWASVD
jgi:16S rRNA (guanine966-N2)-methyltransferase